MSHGVSNAAIDFLEVSPTGMKFRLGLMFRATDDPFPSEFATQRAQRIQIASPPPARTDDTPWEDGLLVDGHPFDPDAPDVGKSVVSPLPRKVRALANLTEPAKATLIFDRTYRVPLVDRTADSGHDFDLLRPDDEVRSGPFHFISIDYDPELVKDAAGNSLIGRTARAAYYLEDEIKFFPAAGPYIAVSLSAFMPPERVTAEYIVPIPRNT